MEQYKLEVAGLSRDDAARLAELLGVQPSIDNVGPLATRSAGELVSAAFILGVLNALPALTAPVTEFLTKLREQKYIKFKLSLDGGETFVEGAATPENIEALSKTLKRIKAKP